MCPPQNILAPRALEQLSRWESLTVHIFSRTCVFLIQQLTNPRRPRKVVLLYHSTPTLIILWRITINFVFCTTYRSGSSILSEINLTRLLVANIWHVHRSDRWYYSRDLLVSHLGCNCLVGYTWLRTLVLTTVSYFFFIFFWQVSYLFKHH